MTKLCVRKKSPADRRLPASRLNFVSCILHPACYTAVVGCPRFKVFHVKTGEQYRCIAVLVCRVHAPAYAPAGYAVSALAVRLSASTIKLAGVVLQISSLPLQSMLRSQPLKSNRCWLRYIYHAQSSPTAFTHPPLKNEKQTNTQASTGYTAVSVSSAAHLPTPEARKE